MAKHDVELWIDHPINIGNRDVQFPVAADGKAYGRVQISKGGIDWMPAKKQKAGYWLTWQEFADLMAEHGREK
jgi:hypothetical protein